MQRIKVEQAEPGMVTAHPVEMSNGQILCAKGAELTETVLERLAKLEISHITVEGHPVDDGKPRKTLEEELSDLDQRFRTVTDHKIMHALKMVVRKHIHEKHRRAAEEEVKDTLQQEEAEAEKEVSSSSSSSG